MKHPLLFACILLLCCGDPLLHGQDRVEGAGKFRIGISGGASLGRHSGDFVFRGEPVAAEEIMRWGYSAGLFAEYDFNDVFSIASRFLYAAHPRKGVDEWEVMIPAVGMEPATIRQEYLFRYDLLELDLMGKTRLFSIGEGRVGVAAGAALGYTVALEESSYERLVSPSDANLFYVPSPGVTLRDSGRVRVYAEDEPIERASSTRFSLRGGAFYEFSLFDGIRMTPGAYFDYGLTSVLKDVAWDTDWKMNAWIFQLDVTMAL